MPNMVSPDISRKSLEDCHRRIGRYIHRTPVLSSRLINGLAGCQVFFKCENFQRMGAYKMRGATNAILCLTQEEKKKGVVTHSSGNFAQALSLAAQSLGVKAYIVMPSSAPKVKKDAVLQYEGEIIECEPTLEARNQTAREIVKKTGATFIHPSNDINVITGQGTACMELLQEHPDLDAVLAPVGGGGLIAGTSLAVHYFTDNGMAIGAEPFEVDDAYRSMQSGKIESNLTTNTMADGLKTVLGTNTFPLIQKHVERIIRVTEAEIALAMRLVWERMKIIIEPSSAVAFAALLREKGSF